MMKDRLWESPLFLEQSPVFSEEAGQGSLLSRVAYWPFFWKLARGRGGVREC